VGARGLVEIGAGDAGAGLNVSQGVARDNGAGSSVYRSGLQAVERRYSFR
jgi:hypothetical protein